MSFQARNSSLTVSHFEGDIRLLFQERPKFGLETLWKNPNQILDGVSCRDGGDYRGVLGGGGGCV